MLQLATAGATTAEVVSVLLIEDDEADSLLTRELLHDTGLAVSLTWQQSIGGAVPELAQGARRACCSISACLTREGFDGLRRVLELAPDAAVLVLTSANDESLGVGAVTAGAQDYLVKGQVDGTMLGRCIRYAIERKRADESARQLHEAAHPPGRVRPARARPAARADPERPEPVPRAELPARPRPGAARRRLLRPDRARRRHAARAHRRRGRPRT